MAIKYTKRKVTVAYESEESGDQADDINMESEGDSESSEQDGNNKNTNINPGWADSISKILKTNKPKGKKTLVLSKAKKLSDVKPKAIDAGYEIQTQDGGVEREHFESVFHEEPKQGKILQKKKKEVISVRKKPNILEKDRERTLSKIATKGVVQLFNAVKKQQKDIDLKLRDAGSLEVKRDKVFKNIDKREFLNVLRGNKQTLNEKVVQKSMSTLKQKEGEQIWGVLRDDFMMGAKMKDWDKELEVESEMEVAIESE